MACFGSISPVAATGTGRFFTSLMVAGGTDSVPDLNRETELQPEDRHDDDDDNQNGADCS